MAKDMYQKRKERKAKAIEEKPDKGGLQKTVINWYPGHMAKTKRLIEEKYDLIDVVLELVDARIPYSSKIKDIDLLIKNKPRVLIMTKSDLCDLKETNKWVKYYEELGYKVLLLDLTNNKDFMKVVKATEELTKEINVKRELKGLNKKEIKALVVGIPNVGKSTLINQLAGKKVANTGNNPGITKNLSWLKTNYNILLLDTPGILWPKFDNDDVGLNLACTAAIKLDVLPIDSIAVHVLEKLNKYYPNILKERYKIDHISDDIVETYDLIGRSLNFLKRGNEVDEDRVSMTIVNDMKTIIKGITFDRKDDLNE